MSQIMNEEVPLLSGPSENEPEQIVEERKRTPLPWRHVYILLLFQVSEPITYQTIEPFLPQLIRDIGVTGGKDSRVAYYIGLMQSLYFLTEACTTFHWSRLSDNIGRKPVLLLGLFGLSASMWCFGLSKTFLGLVSSRCLNVALNGNGSVMKSMTIDITDPTNIAYAYGILPVAWSLGDTLGPLIGGALARPAERFPDVFGQSMFLKEHPYFLPCAVSATVTALMWIVVFMFMEETTKYRVTLWQYISRKTTKYDPEVHESAHDDPLPEETDQPLPLRSLLVRPVITATGSYATFALIDIAFRAVIPVFCALPIEMGGLNLDPPAIGNILAYIGVSGGIIQFMFFAPLHDWLGAKLIFLVSVSLCFPVIVLFPVINAAARMYGVGYLVWFLVGIQMTLFMLASFAYVVAYMYVGAAAPNKASIGATNGLAQVVVSIMRTIGPATVNSAFSLSIEKHVMGGYFAYFVMMVMVSLTMWVGSLLPRTLWKE